MHVINYELPTVIQGGIDEYVHRIGRTARIGHLGTSTSFFSDRDEQLAPALVKILKENDQPVPDFLQNLAGETGGTDDNSAGNEEVTWGDEPRSSTTVAHDDADSGFDGGW